MLAYVFGFQTENCECELLNKRAIVRSPDSTLYWLLMQWKCVCVWNKYEWNNKYKYCISFTCLRLLSFFYTCTSVHGEWWCLNHSHSSLCQFTWLNLYCYDVLWLYFLCACLFRVIGVLPILVPKTWTFTRLAPNKTPC